jgi:hypothetical protein
VSTPDRANVTVTAPYAGPVNSGVPRRNIPGTHFLKPKVDSVMEREAYSTVEKAIDALIASKGLS